jgi:acylphosphatase
VGQVCNLPDGRVRLIVRGPAEDVAGLVERLEATFAGHVRHVEQSELPPGEDDLPDGIKGVEITRGH